MADPFALVNRALERSAGASPGSRRKRPGRNPDNPKDLEYLRSIHPDFEEVMVLGQMDYRTRCQRDASFASSFRLPPVIEPTRVFREHTNSVDAVCWGPEPGHFLSASHDATLKLWNAQTGTCTKTLQGHGGGVFHCAVSSSRKLIASCGSGEEWNALIWQWPEAQVCLALTGHRRSVVHAAFSPDSSCVGTVDLEGTLLVSDLAQGACKLRQALHLGAAHSSCFCWNDTNLLCTAGGDGFIQILDLREACLPPFWQQPSASANCVSVRTTRSISTAHDGHAVYAVEFTDCERILSCGADHKLKRWDLRMLRPGTPKCLLEYLGHTSPIRSLAVAPNQRFLVTGCEDGSCRIWPADALGDVQASLQELRTKAQDVEARFQQATEPEEARDLRRKRDELREAAASVRASKERLARVGHGSAALALRGHAGLVSGCAWGEDATNRTATVLSSSWDQTIQLYSVDVAELA